jgi:hypothetical protein
MVGGRAVLPALPEGQVDVQHGRALQLQLQVVPGRPAAIPRVDPDRIGVAEMLGVITAAAGQVNAADEGDAADGVVRAVDDQELLVVAAEAAHPLVSDQLPAGPVDQGAQDPDGVLVEPDQGRMRAPQQSPDGHPAAGEGGQQRPQLATGAGQLAGGVDAPVGQVTQSPAPSSDSSSCRRPK